MGKFRDYPAAGSVTSDDLILIVNAPGGTAATQYTTLQALRTSLFGAGSSYTTTDPLTAGAASFTTGAFSGNLTVGSSAFVVTAATGAVSITGQPTIAYSGAVTVIKDTAAYSAGANGSALYFQALDSTSVNSTLALWQSYAKAARLSDFVLYLGQAGSTFEAARWSGGATAAATTLNLYGPLAITGALTGVTTLAASGTVTFTNASFTCITASGAGPTVQFGGVANGATTTFILGEATNNTTFSFVTAAGILDIKRGATTLLTLSDYGPLRFANLGTPAVLTNGEMWYDGTNIKVRLGGATKTVTVA